MASDVMLANASNFLLLSKTNPSRIWGGQLERFAKASCPHASATIAIVTFRVRPMDDPPGSS